MLSRAAFLVSFPEFSEVDPPLVDAKLAEAALMIDPLVFGTRTDTAHGYRTADLLASSPMGNDAKLSNGQTTVYYPQYLRIAGAVTQGIRNT